MNRTAMLGLACDPALRWDVLVIGGGATGIGTALDAAARGYRALVLEQRDFGSGTSSRSTKLVHGGVRYLQQGNVPLVIEALHERGILRRNAPHLVHDLAFVVPNYLWWEAPFYGIGMRVYDLLAGRHGFGRSQVLSVDDVLERIPALEREGLRGGVLYHDGQFDDSRLLIHLARTAAELGACLVNDAEVVAIEKDAGGYVTGARWRDRETGREHVAGARVTVNATGPFCDAIRRLDDSAAAPMIAPSQGVHLVLDRRFLGGETAIMVPRTRDDRVMFAIPWHGHTVIGTTDTPIDHVTLEPRPLEQEVDFILETAGQYLASEPARGDILSVFTGIRPLVKAGDAGSTAALSREHTIQISQSGLITIAGGKWTTYRRMAEDCVNHAVALGGLEERPSRTRDLRLHGYDEQAAARGPLLREYGSDAAAIEALMREDPAWSRQLDERLPIVAAEIVWAARHEMARTVDDALARRTRALFLNARAAIAMAPAVAELMARELGHDVAWQRAQVAEFCRIAGTYLPE